MHKWTDEQIAYLREIATGRTRKEITQMLNSHFGIDLPQQKVVSAMKNRKITTGLTGYFEKGKPSWNSGMKGLQLGGEKGYFKKGRIPLNHRQVGSERISRDGYIEVKVAEPNKWALKHKHLWEQANGKVPPKHCLIFLDGDKQNLALENIALIKRAELARMNQLNLIYSDPELTQAGILVARYLTAVNSKKTKNESEVLK